MNKIFILTIFSCLSLETLGMNQAARQAGEIEAQKHVWHTFHYSDPVLDALLFGCPYEKREKLSDMITENRQHADKYWTIKHFGTAITTYGFAKLMEYKNYSWEHSFEIFDECPMDVLGGDPITHPGVFPVRSQTRTIVPIATAPLIAYMNRLKPDYFDYEKETSSVQLTRRGRWVHNLGLAFISLATVLKLWYSYEESIFPR